MTRDLRFAKTADADLDRIWKYIAEYDADAAYRMIDRLRAATARLADYPRSAPVRIQSLYELRGISAHRHILFYVFDAKTVTITRVFDARQDWLSELLS